MVVCAPPAGRLPPTAAAAKWLYTVPSGYPPLKNESTRCAEGRMAHSFRSVGALVHGPQPNPALPTGIVSFPRPPPPPARRAPWGGGAGSSPARAGR